MSPPPPPPIDNRLRFDKTINLGHILTMGAFLLTAMVQWNMVDKRILVLEEARVSQRERDTTQDSASKENLMTVKDALKDLSRSVERVADKVGATNK